MSFDDIYVGDMMKKALATLLMVAAGAFLTACGGGSSSADKAQIRFVHVSPGTDNINLTFDGSSAATSLKYHDATGYQNVTTGSPEFKVTSATTGATLVDTTVTLSASTHYTFFVYGGGSTVSAASLNDDVSDASSGKFQMRLSHSATGIGSLDVYLLAAGSKIQDNTPAYSAMGYAANTGFIEYSKGDYSIVLAPAGTKEVIYDSGKQTFSENAKVTLLIYATGSGKLANVALMLDDGSGTTTFLDSLYSRFKFVNAAVDLHTADVLIDGIVTLANIPYGGLSSYGSISAGPRNVKIQASSAPGAYLYDQSQTLSAAYDYSLVAYSVAGTAAVNLFALQDNNLPPASGKAKLRVVNAGSDTTIYDAYVNYSKFLPAIGPATGSSYQELDSGTYVLGFAATGTTTQATTLAGQELDAAHIYTVYVYGRSGGAAAAVLVRDY